MIRIAFISIAAFLALPFYAQHAVSQPGDICNPNFVLLIAQRANNYFMSKYPDPKEPTFVKKVRPSNLWTRAVYYEGLVALNDISPEQRYLDYIDKWAVFHRWEPRNGTGTTDADDQCCSQIYLSRYIQDPSEEKIAPTRENLLKQMGTGKYGYWTWIDAIQMAMPVYAMMSQITRERKYIDYAMRMYTWSRDTCASSLFNVDEGLWWRDKDYVTPYQEPDGNNCYWSRGNGWVYAALVRVMTTLKKKDPYYKQLKKDFLLMSDALRKCQREDGFWSLSLVSTNFEGKEMTGTALFLYGMSWGIQHGLLNKKQFKVVCDKAWKALATESIHNDGFLGFNQGTGKDPSAGQPVTYTSVPDFEDYGTGCFLLGATEYYKLLNAK